MSIEYIQKKKLCPLMSDYNNKVYCTTECAFVSEHYDTNTNEFIGVTCGMFSFERTLESIDEKLDVLLSTR